MTYFSLRLSLIFLVCVSGVAKSDDSSPGDKGASTESKAGDFPVDRKPGAWVIPYKGFRIINNTPYAKTLSVKIDGSFRCSFDLGGRETILFYTPYLKKEGSFLMKATSRGGSLKETYCVFDLTLVQEQVGDKLVVFNALRDANPQSLDLLDRKKTAGTIVELPQIREVEVEYTEPK